MKVVLRASLVVLVCIFAAPRALRNIGTTRIEIVEFELK